MTQTTLPKNIKTAQDFNNWSQELKDKKLGLYFQMKRRTQFSPFSLSELDGDSVDYLIDDSVSRGQCSIRNMNRSFNIFICDWELGNISNIKLK